MPLEAEPDFRVTGEAWRRERRTGRSAARRPRRRAHADTRGADQPTRPTHQSQLASRSREMRAVEDDVGGGARISSTASYWKASTASTARSRLAGDGLYLPLAHLRQRQVVVVAEDDADPAGVRVDVQVGAGTGVGTGAPEHSARRYVPGRSPSTSCRPRPRRSARGWRYGRLRGRWECRGRPPASPAGPTARSTRAPPAGCRRCVARPRPGCSARRCQRAGCGCSPAERCPWRTPSGRCPRCPTPSPCPAAPTDVSDHQRDAASHRYRRR